MATRTIIIDDIDGREGDPNDPVRARKFSIDGDLFEIDLRQGNMDRMRELLADYILHARRIPQRDRSKERARAASTANEALNGASVPAGASPAPGREDSADVRKWAQDNGYQIGDHGRMPKEIHDAYRRANVARVPSEA